ncbi:PD40 domain-containing protein [Candidatus Poribacteria bacterium]|nr:PD40 domain-containing protein [Candidatus Poribacteria bacterium]
MRYELSNRSYRFCVNLMLLFLLYTLFSLNTYAKIVFTSKREGDATDHIYVMEDNGSNVRRITPSAFYDYTPRWFPDGKQILFVRDHSRGNGHVFNNEFYIIDATGLNEHRFMFNHPTDKSPVISPNGKKIAFNSNRSGNWDIFTMNLETGLLKQLTDNDFPRKWSHRMDWSPDGKQIAYQHDGENDNTWNVWIMDADGKRKKLFSPNPDRGTILRRGPPAWSPSGKYIMYDDHIFNQDANRALQPITSQLIIHSVVTGVREVHNFPKVSQIAMGCWMGDDRKVLLCIKADGTDPESDYEIYQYDLISRKLTNLTNHPKGDYEPHWIEGSLSVTPMGKLTTQWAQLKQAY